jgi:hypothetical protein
MTSTQPTDEEVLQGLCDNEDVDSLCTVWEILRRRIPVSLLSNKPTSRVTPKVWVLNREALSFTEDKEWLLKNLRGHRVVPVRDQVFERANAAPEEPVVEVDVSEQRRLKNDAVSILLTEPAVFQVSQEGLKFLALYDKELSPERITELVKQTGLFPPFEVEMKFSIDRRPQLTEY